MRKLLILAAVVFVFLSLSSVASALVLTFDEYSVSASSYNYRLPSNYGGFDWSTDFGIVSDARYMGVYGNNYGATSVSNAAYNFGGVLQTVVTSSSLFDFNGASFSSFSQNDAPMAWGSAAYVTLEGYSNGAMVGSVFANLSNNSYNWLQAGFLGIDELRITSPSDRTWWVMDDFTFNEQTAIASSASGTAPVPEPSTMILLGLGILGMGAMGRKKLTPTK